jgi:adenylate kinase family enzyme
LPDDRPPLKKVAVFGNTGGGKSTLSRRLAVLTGLPLHPLDLLQWCPGGEPVPHVDYLKAHTELMQQDEWLIDGYGCPTTLWERLAAADTLVYVDLPVYRHFLWVTKRCLMGLFISPPEGWPTKSPILRGTMMSYRVLSLCHKHLTPKYRAYVAEQRAHKRVYHLQSVAEMEKFLVEVGRQFSDPAKP